MVALARPVGAGDPAVTDPTPAQVAAPLRSCAAHGRNFWLGHDSRSFGGRFFCPAYLRELFEGFDPQPFTPPVMGQREGQHTIRLIDGGWPTPDTHYVVLERQGDLLTVRPVGMPDIPPTEVQVAACWPTRYVPPSSRTCGK